MVLTRADQSGSRRYSNLAIATISRKVEARKKAALRGDPVNKELYKIWMMGGGRDTERELDPQGWLADQLRTGKRVRFFEGFSAIPSFECGQMGS